MWYIDFLANIGQNHNLGNEMTQTKFSNLDMNMQISIRQAALQFAVAKTNTDGDKVVDSATTYIDFLMNGAQDVVVNGYTPPTPLAVADNTPEPATPSTIIEA
jgi:hypothetical protein